MTMLMFALMQPDTPLPIPASNWYTSVAGIVAATIFVVSILKRALGNLRGFNAVPTWLYACVISGTATYLCVAVWKTMPGPLWQLVIQAVFMAAAASGFYEWYNNGNKTLAASAKSAGVRVEAKNDPTV